MPTIPNLPEMTLAVSASNLIILEDTINNLTKKLTVTELNKLSSVHGSENAIINGDFNIWQRGTSFAAIASGTFCTDRFEYFEAGDMVHTISRDTDVPALSASNHQSSYSIKIDCTTADASIATGDFALIVHKIEGYNFAPFQGQKATLSFYVNATKTGTYCIAFRNAGSPPTDRTYIAEYTVSSSDTWEKKTITLTFNPSAGGTWDYTNGVGIQVAWILTCGSTFQTTANTWQNGSFFATSNQVNACDNTANNFWLSQVQFELGDTATDFKYKSIQKEIADCQRYFQKTYNLHTDPGTVTNIGRMYSRVNGVASSAEAAYQWWFFKTLMRDDPTVVTYSAGTGNSGKCDMPSGEFDSTVQDPSMSGVMVSGTDSVAGTTRNIRYHATADAEL